jgi:hypothetical protein
MTTGRSSTWRGSLISAAVAGLALASACSSGSNGSSTSGVGPGGTSGGPTAASGGSTTAASPTGSGTGTGGSATATTGGTGTGGVGLGATIVARAGFSSPFDAVLDSSGATVYFTALAATGPTIFSAAASGSAAAAPTDLAVTGLAGPLGLAISSDNAKLFAADVVFEDPATGALGQIVSVPASGGAATPVSGTPGYAPIGLTAVGSGGDDTLYFTGTDPTNGKPGVFSVAASGGTPAAVAEGAPFLTPSGIAVDTNGTVYVVDQSSVIAVSGGAATVLASGFATGYPGGVAFSADGSSLYVSSADPATGNDAVAVVALTPGQAVTYQLGGATGPFNGFSDPAGLHGIGTSSSFVDATASGSGAIYVIQ